jgi:hypothetical protein
MSHSALADEEVLLAHSSQNNIGGWDPASTSPARCDSRALPTTQSVLPSTSSQSPTTAFHQQYAFTSTQQRLLSRQRESVVHNQLPVPYILRQMLTASPPLDFGTDERRHQHDMHASAVALRRGANMADEEARGATLIFENDFHERTDSRGPVSHHDVHVGGLKSQHGRGDAAKVGDIGAQTSSLNEQVAELDTLEEDERRKVFLAAETRVRERMKLIDKELLEKTERTSLGIKGKRKTLRKEPSKKDMHRLSANKSGHLKLAYPNDIIEVAEKRISRVLAGINEDVERKFEEDRNKTPRNKLRKRNRGK